MLSEGESSVYARLGLPSLRTRRQAPQCGVLRSVSYDYAGVKDTFTKVGLFDHTESCALRLVICSAWMGLLE